MANRTQIEKGAKRKQLRILIAAHKSASKALGGGEEPTEKKGEDETKS